MATTAPDWPQLTEATVGRSFTGSIDPVRTGPAYKLGLLLLTLLMALLPLIYLGLIALTGWAVFQHATGGFASVDGGGARAQGLFYLSPLVMGVVVLICMVKPLFAPAAARAEPRPLQRKQAPLLFAFVDRICNTVGAPRPSMILLDNEVNASASFRSGLRGGPLHPRLLRRGYDSH
jgi:hypothetical protein